MTGIDDLEPDDGRTPKEHVETFYKDPEFNKVALGYRHPSEFDFTDGRNNDRYRYADQSEITEEQLEKYYYSLLCLRNIGTGISKKVVGEFMYAVYEMHENDNIVPLLQLFWTLVGQDISEDFHS